MKDSDSFWKFSATHLSTFTVAMGFVSGVAVMGSVWAIVDAGRTRQDAIGRANQAIIIARSEADRAVRNYETLMVYIRGLHSQLRAEGFKPPELPTQEIREIEVAEIRSGG